MDWNRSARTRVFGVPQHVRYDEKAHMATTDVNLVEVGDTSVACGDGYILELDVHVVFGYSEEIVSGGFPSWASDD